MTNQIHHYTHETGIRQQAAHKRGAELPKFTGRHLWVYAGAWKVDNPAAERQIFDVENLITIDGPGCMWCEQPWHPTIGAHCPGEPRE